MNPRYVKGAWMVLGAAILLSLQPIFARAAYADGANVWGVLLLRFLPPGLLLVLLLPRPKGLKVIPALLLGGSFGLVATLYYAALHHISSGLTAILLYLYPLIIFVTALVTRQESLTLRRSAALSMALLGIYLSVDVVSGSSLLGISLGVASAFACAVYIMACRRVLPEEGGLANTGWVMLGATLLFLIPLVFGQTEFPNGVQGYTAGFALSTLCGLLPMSMLIVGIQWMQKETDVGILCTIEPISTLFFAWALLAEPLTGSSLAGAGLIVIALILLMLPARRQAVAVAVQSDIA